MLKKIFAFFMTAVIAVSMLALTAGAASVKDYAKAAESGKKYAGSVVQKGKFSPVAYKVELKKKGTLRVDFAFHYNDPWFFLLNGNKKYFNPDDVTTKIGSLDCCKESYFGDKSDGTGWGTVIKHDEKNGKSAGVAFYRDLEPGTYYFRLSRGAGNEVGQGDYALTFSYGGKYDSDAGQESGIDITIELPVKGTVQLGAMLGKSEVKAKWSSSNKKVASVSADGTVTAKKKGTAVITAKSGDYEKTIKIVVK